jgi:prolyl-tRNA synthetase
VVPIVRDRPEDRAVIEYCQAIAAELTRVAAFGEPLRVIVDLKAGRPVDKRWGWIKRGVPIVCEIGARDAASGAVTLLKRHRARRDGKLAFETAPRDEFVLSAPDALAEIQASLYSEARERMRANIRSDLATLADVETYFKDSAESESFCGWAEVPWSRPEGAELDRVQEQLKRLKLTVRVAPLGQPRLEGRRCAFTGAAAKEVVLLGRAY